MEEPNCGISLGKFSLIDLAHFFFTPRKQFTNSLWHISIVNTWTLIQHLEKRLEENLTRMLCAVLNKS